MNGLLKAAATWTDAELSSQLDLVLDEHDNTWTGTRCFRRETRVE